MPLTTLDKKAALVLIDLQKGIVSYPAAHPTAEIIGRAGQLARTFRAHHLPVVLVHVTGAVPRRVEVGFPKFTPPADWTEFVPELDQQPQDYVIDKQTWGAFIGTGLDDILRQLGVTQIFLGGVSTSIGVESTARSAFDHAYNLVLVTDAMTDRDLESHNRSVEKIFPRLGERATTEEVLKMLGESER